MPENGQLIRNISDTALWVAHYRAVENDRPDRVFSDPYARRLAGKRGEEIAHSIQFLNRAGWPFIARTWLIDKFVMDHVKQGYDMVINLAAGLDTRPYRMDLPATLQWVEVDLPEILQYKQQIMEKEKPRCQLEQVALDLSEQTRRKELFEQLGPRSQKALIITEGLLIYLPETQVVELAEELASQKSFKRWVLDMASPALVEMMNRNIGDKLDQAKAPFRFAPKEGPAFFEKHQWHKLEVHSQLKTAAQLKRLPMMLRIMSFLFRGKKPVEKRPWSGVCLFGRER